MRKLCTALSIVMALSVASCKSVGSDGDAASATAKGSLDRLDRTAFNKAALRLNLPLFWVYEETPSSTVRPEIVTTLNFYPTSDSLVWKGADGKFTAAFYDAYEKMVAVSKDPLMGGKTDDANATRLVKVADELDQAALNVVATDFTSLSDGDKKFVRAMLKAGAGIDAIYARQTGLDVAMSKIPADDYLSRSMARRNWGVTANSAKMKDDKACRAVNDRDVIPVGVYPAALQSDADFCATLAARADAETLLTPFTVVVADADGALSTVPYSVAFKDEMKVVSDALKEAAAALEGNASEAALRAYLSAAAESFLTNDWEPANEAWAAMNSVNSKWYVRCAPDEVYWDPCARKAGFHMTFARINPDALAWQEKLTPLQQEMEHRLAGIAGEPYVARTVSFHLPDFIDIVTNSGDDRDSFGATIGQSLPNWGPVANEGRGRTVAMSNLYTDPDSQRDRRTLSSSLFTDADLGLINCGAMPGLLSTILHEAAHNLGPAHEYTVDGKVDDDIFGGALASLAEEFKAQTSALWFIPFLLERGVISQELANQSYADDVYWALGHISRGMEDGEGHIQPYSQLAAIQIGMMLDEGALEFDANKVAANGTDKGAFVLHLDKMPACVDKIMDAIAKIKSTGNKAGLEALQKRYVYGDVIPFDVIRDRMLRLPKTSFVYSVKM